MREPDLVDCLIGIYLDSTEVEEEEKVRKERKDFNWDLGSGS